MPSLTMRMTSLSIFVFPARDSPESLKEWLERATDHRTSYIDLDEETLHPFLPLKCRH